MKTVAIQLSDDWRARLVLVASLAAQSLDRHRPAGYVLVGRMRPGREPAGEAARALVEACRRPGAGPLCGH